jgi:hypothetical protein
MKCSSSGKECRNDGLPGIPKRIQRIRQFHQKRIMASRTDPGLSTLGGWMMVVKLNSIKIQNSETQFLRTRNRCLRLCCVELEDLKSQKVHVLSGKSD